MSPTKPLHRVSSVEWSAVAADLNAQGWAVIPKLLAGE